MASVAHAGCFSPPCLGNDLRGCRADAHVCVRACVVRFVCIHRELDRNKRKREQNKGLNLSGGVRVKRRSRCGFTHHPSGTSRGTLLNLARSFCVPNTFYCPGFRLVPARELVRPEEKDDPDNRRECIPAVSNRQLALTSAPDRGRGRNAKQIPRQARRIWMPRPRLEILARHHGRPPFSCLH